VPRRLREVFTSRGKHSRGTEALADSWPIAAGSAFLVGVDSNYHARRTRFIFGRIFGPGVTAARECAHDSEFDPSHWWDRVWLKLFSTRCLPTPWPWWELQASLLQPVAGSFSRSDASPRHLGHRRHSTAFRRYLFGNILVRTHMPVYNATHVYYSPQSPCSPAALSSPSHVATEFRNGGTMWRKPETPTVFACCRNPGSATRTFAALPG